MAIMASWLLITAGALIAYSVSTKLKNTVLKHRVDELEDEVLVLKTKLEQFEEKENSWANF